MDRTLKLLESLNIDKQKDKVVVACSGGPDSMFLLALLNRLHYQVIVAHVHHNVRKESDEEYVFLEKYCHEHNMIFEGTKILEYPHENFHNYARTYRYNFFEKVLDKYHAHYLFTAHHGDDLMETILMRISRGSSLSGYAGFKAITTRDKYQIIRPLMSMTKDEILQYVLEENIPYVHDLSNETDHYLRNRLRHHVLPVLKQENPQVHLKFGEYNQEMEEVYHFVDNYVQKQYRRIVKDNVFDIAALEKEDNYIKKQIIYRYLHSIYNDKIVLINQQHIAQILEVMANNKPNLSISLPEGYNFIKSYGQGYVQKPIETGDYEYILNEQVELPMGRITIIKNIDDEAFKQKSNYFIRLNSEYLKMPLIIRNRRVGDRIKVKNLANSKKVKDIFINEKVDLDKRNMWPILTDSNNNVLWLPGLKKSEFDVPIGCEYDIIVKYEKKENHDEQ